MKCWEMVYARTEGFSTLWISHTFSTSYHMVSFLKEMKKLWRVSGQEIFVTRVKMHPNRVDFFRVRMIFPIHHLLMTFVFNLIATCGETFFARGYRPCLVAWCSCAREQTPGRKEAVSVGASLPRYTGKVGTDKTCTMHSNVPCAM